MACKGAAGRAVGRAFRWAHNEGMIARNPLANMRLEQPEPRVTLLSPATHEAMIMHCRSSSDARPFALYLIASHCGARPQQIRDVTVDHISPDGTRWTFQKHKNKKKTRKALTVYLSPCLQTLVRIILASRRDSAHLFVNSLGEPWKKNTVCQRMRRLKKVLRIDDELIAYSYRHTYATDALRAGVDIPTVSAVMGTSSEMISRVYGHLGEHPKHLLDAAKRTTAKRHES